MAANRDLANGLDGTLAGSRVSDGSVRWPRVLRALAAALAVAALLRGAHFIVTMPDPAHSVGIDYRIVIGGAREFLEGRGFYPDVQLHGPYGVGPWGAIRYPPVALYLFAPFVYLPAVLWWAIPAVLFALALRRLRPAPWALAAMAFLALLPPTQAPVIYGNPVIWLVPAAAWGFIRGWPAVAILAKPTLAPFALVGIRHRSWWYGLAVFVGLCLLLAPLWPDWIASIVNGPVGADHSVRQVPVMAIPLVAWLGRDSTSVGRTVAQARTVAARLARS